MPDINCLTYPALAGRRLYDRTISSSGSTRFQVSFGWKKHCEHTWKSEIHFGKAIPVLQSSETCKSRLVTELGRSVRIDFPQNVTVAHPKFRVLGHQRMSSWRRTHGAKPQSKLRIGNVSVCELLSSPRSQSRIRGWLRPLKVFEFNRSLIGLTEVDPLLQGEELAATFMGLSSPSCMTQS